jgi:hypothetical protein
MFSENALTFGEYISEQAKWFPWMDPAKNNGDDYFLRNALHIFSLTIRDALFKATSRAVQVSYQLKADEAKRYMLYGVGRRIKTIWDIYGDFLSLVPIKREEPLNSKESQTLGQSLNLLYLNISGTLDNLCWAVLSECAPENLDHDRPTRNSLFLPCITKDIRFKSLAEAIGACEEWNKDMKTRRNPAAHRIPLTVPSQVFSSNEEASEYQKLLDEYWQTGAKLDFDGAGEIMQRAKNVGKFIPIFLHHPDEGVYKIYPTVPNDIGQMVKTFRAVDSYLSQSTGGE